MNRDELNSKIVELKKRVDSGDVKLSDSVAKDLERITNHTDDVTRLDDLTPEIRAAVKTLDVNKK
ncbi:hypothetical protein [Aneurinibacillus sp. REN35]|uniref:hypothetical protein n=1 Tax=Aneurinibacillus sp. REN35 TaxID=3237286 RepID=UPI003528DFE5